MRKHHTKNKGDLGVVHAIADLTEKGWRVLLPMSEHEAFDLVAYRGDQFLRVQVKYRAASRGTILVPFATCWADRHGVHKVQIDKTAIELMCVYCPDTRRCYYLDPRQFRRNVSLRLVAPRNAQKKRIHLADDFLDIPATVQGYPSGLVES